MCRAQFEKDDTVEAEIVCGHRETVDLNMQGDEISNNKGDVNGNNSIQATRQRSSMFTLKLPAWFNFSYTTLPYTPRRPHRRNSNSSGLQSQINCSSLRALSQDIQLHNKLDSGMHENPAFSQPPLAGASTKLGLTTDDFTPATDTPGLVVAHPSPIPWDDQTTVDLPYDNPFYTKAYDNVLWLPRNPCGILNLDDTIDLKASLTTEVSAGHLGTWLDIPETSSPHEVPQADGRVCLGRPLKVATGLPPVDGTEDIDLPSVIAKRVRSREDGIEQAVGHKRPSSYHRQILGGYKIKASTEPPPQPRNSAVDSPLPLALRSFSNGPDRGKGRARSSSMSTLNHSPHTHHAWLTDQRKQEPASPRVRHAQAELATVIGIGNGISMSSRPPNVSARVAIAQEVVAEEEAALVNRTEDEQAKVHKATATKSWITSWMFKKSE